MASAMRCAVVALAAIACLVASAAPASAYSGLPPQESGVFGADGSFRKTGTEVGKPGQTVSVLGFYRIVDDEIFGSEKCPSTGLSRIQGLLPGATVSASVVQYNWASKAVPRVQLANRAFKCGGEVRVELELYAQVDRCQAGLRRFLCFGRRADGCQNKAFATCNINITGELRLYEGTSDTTDKLRKTRSINVTLVGGTFVPSIFPGVYIPLLPGGKSVDQNYGVKADAGDSVEMNLQFSVQPTVILQ